VDNGSELKLYRDALESLVKSISDDDRGYIQAREDGTGSHKDYIKNIFNAKLKVAMKDFQTRSRKETKSFFGLIPGLGLFRFADFDTHAMKRLPDGEIAIKFHGSCEEQDTKKGKNLQISGCLWDTRTLVLTLGDADSEHKQIEKLLKDIRTKLISKYAAKAAGYYKEFSTWGKPSFDKPYTNLHDFLIRGESIPEVCFEKPANPGPAPIALADNTQKPELEKVERAKTCVDESTQTDDGSLADSANIVL
jgi:hypothetical protein